MSEMVFGSREEQDRNHLYARIKELEGEIERLRAESASVSRAAGFLSDLATSWATIADSQEARAGRAEAALDAAAIALENQAHAVGSWHEDEMRMDAARDAAKAARAFNGESE